MNEIPITFHGKGSFNSNNLLYALIHNSTRQFVGLFSSVENAKQMCHIQVMECCEEDEDCADGEIDPYYYSVYEIHIIDFLDKNKPIFVKQWANDQIDTDEGYLTQDSSPPTDGSRRVKVVIDNDFIELY